MTSALCAVAWEHGREWLLLWHSDYDMAWFIVAQPDPLLNPNSNPGEAHLISWWLCSLDTITPNSTLKKMRVSMHSRQAEDHTQELNILFFPTLPLRPTGGFLS